MEELKEIVEYLRKLVKRFEEAEMEIMNEIDPLEAEKATYSKMWDHAMYSINELNSLSELMKNNTLRPKKIQEEEE